MGFRNWSSWLKGGLIGLVIALIYSFMVGKLAIDAIIVYTLIGIILGIITKYSIMLFEMWKFPYWLRGGLLPIVYGLVFIVLNLFYAALGGMSGDPAEIYLIIIPVILIPIGALIGFIIGKIKSKKSQKLNQENEIMK